MTEITVAVTVAFRQSPIGATSSLFIFIPNGTSLNIQKNHPSILTWQIPKIFKGPRGDVLKVLLGVLYSS